MDAVKDEILRALEAVPPEVLRALARVPAEVLDALHVLPKDRPGPAKDSSRSSTFTGSGAEELQLALKRVDELLQATDADVVMTFGKWRDPKDPEKRLWTWWNGWIDS